MKKTITKVADSNVQPVSLSKFSLEAFTKYATETIENRALPDVYDGLKPVTRRVLYSMYMTGMLPSKEPSKAARVVGSVMSSYHPHGDTSIQSAVTTAVNLPTPLIEGTGNWGSLQNPKPSAFRYINCRLSKYGASMLDPDYLAVTPMMPNYDEKESEPVVLPALLPNLFINGSFGIAVGLTTDIPSLEPTGVIKVCQKILNGDSVTATECAKLTRPKFKYGGALILEDKEQKDSWKKYWMTGEASVWISPEYDYDIKTRKLWITGFPPGVKLDTLLDNVRTLDCVVDAEDATDADVEEGRCLVEITLTTAKTFEADVDTVLEYAYGKLNSKTAAVERTHETLQVAEDLKVVFHKTNPTILLHRWCELRVALEVKCLSYKIEKNAKVIRRIELQILACINREKVLASLKSDNPDLTLSKSLKISLDDAKLILDMQIRKLSTLDEKKLKLNLAEHQKTDKELKAWLKKPKAKVVADLQSWLDENEV